MDHYNGEFLMRHFHTWVIRLSWPDRIRRWHKRNNPQIMHYNFGNSFSSWGWFHKLICNLRQTICALRPYLRSFLMAQKFSTRRKRLSLGTKQLMKLTPEHHLIYKHCPWYFLRIPFSKLTQRQKCMPIRAFHYLI